MSANGMDLNAVCFRQQHIAPQLACSRSDMWSGSCRCANLGWIAADSLRVMALAFGSWMKDCPERVLGGSSPVHACLRHSITVCGRGHTLRGHGKAQWHDPGINLCSVNYRPAWPWLS